MRTGFLPFCVGLAIHAGTWAPIPPDVWAMKESPEQGVKGAVILERRMTFNGRAITHVFRARVLSDSGREVAELMEFSPETTSIEGRTVQRDGSVVLFDKLKDFTTKVLPNSDRSGPRRVLIPPGVTTDCVVELRWVEMAGGGEDRQLPWSMGYSAQWWLGSPFKVIEEVVEFQQTYHWSAQVIPGRGNKPEITNDGRGRKYVFRNLPGREWPPYALMSLAGRPVVLAWHQPRPLVGPDRGEALRYWEIAAREFWKPHYYNRLRSGKIFKSFAAELVRDLPTGAPEAAELLLRRLDRRIRNVDFPTSEEKSSLDLKAIQSDSYDQAHDLDMIVNRGAATGQEMGFLFLALLEKAGIHPWLGLLRNRNISLFHFDVPDVYQVQHLLVGVRSIDGRVLWLDPSQRFAAPGLVNPAYQGWETLVVDTATWRPTAAMIPYQPAPFNVSQYTFQMSFEKETERFKVGARFTGYPEFLQRRRFLALTLDEQARQLKESLERGVPDCSITSTQVREAMNPDANIEWEAEGLLDRPTSSTFQFDPFPGMQSPLYLPSAWPEKRTEPIVLTILGIQLGTCEFTLPKGFILGQKNPFIRENSFGKVAFTVSTAAKGQETLVKVVFRVDVLRGFAPAEAYDEFKTFMGWVDEAYHSKVILEKRQ